MRQNRVSFVSGLVTGALLLTLGTTALAASGKISFNASHVALNGERRITAGQMITAPNGQKVPGTILYVDEAGGKTNYLPIRAVSELLGTEIRYDSATKTILLGSAPAPQTLATGWEKTLDGPKVIYQAQLAQEAPEKTPSFRPAKLPEGWKLNEAEEDSVSSSWHYSKGSAHLTFSAVSPRQSQVVKHFSSPTVVQQAEQVAFAGKTGDLYRDQESLVLIWTDSSGNLFSLSGTQVAREELLAAAESVEPFRAAGLSIQADWLPQGYTLFSRRMAGDTVSELWSREGEIITLTASRSPLETPDRSAEAVTIGQRNGQYWAREDNSPLKKPEGGSVVAVAPGITVSTNQQVGVHSKRASVLSWMREDIHFRLIAPPGIERDTMLRIAENLH